MIDRKSAFWVVVVMLVALFALFAIMAAFLQPAVDFNTGDAMVDDLLTHASRMAWWSTIALVMLPVILLLISVAVYLFLTSVKVPGVPYVGNGAVNTLVNGKDDKSVPVVGGKTPLDLLSERYVRGELTRDQYNTMRKDIVGKDVSAK